MKTQIHACTRQHTSARVCDSDAQLRQVVVLLFARVLQDGGSEGDRRPKPTLENALRTRPDTSRCNLSNPPNAFHLPLNC